MLYCVNELNEFLQKPRESDMCKYNNINTISKLNQGYGFELKKTIRILKKN